MEHLFYNETIYNVLVSLKNTEINKRNIFKTISSPNCISLCILWNLNSFREKSLEGINERLTIYVP